MSTKLTSHAIPTWLETRAGLSDGAIAWLIGCAVLCAAAFIAPGVPFIVDGGMYLDMARSLVENKSLAVSGNGGIDGAPPLVKFLTIVHDGQTMPQYPSGYAFLAAPFYALFGVHGLMLMNALSFALCIRLSYALAKSYYSEQTARWAAGIFAVATFTPTYMLGIWPHLTALAFWLGAILCATTAVQSKDHKRTWIYLALSGLLIGTGVNIRIDSFLPALIIFFWLRLFARPDDRLAPLALALGTAPGLIIAAYLNHLKFGVFTPFTYGDTKGLDSMAPYLGLAAAVGVTLLFVWAVNVRKLVEATFSQRLRRYAIAAMTGLIVLAIAVSPFRDFIWRILTGLYVLIINLQAHDAYRQVGVEENAYGHLLYWGYPKKALIQSIPWAPLLILPAWGAIRGRNIMAVSLCFFAIAAPICFYAMNQWHGGGSYSMRYFMPALPFLAMLAAAGFQELRKGNAITRQTILIALTISAALYLGLQELGKASERFFAPAALYPQWIIATLLVGAIITYLTTSKEGPRKAAIALSLFAFSYALAVNIYEEIGHERTRAEQKALAEDISAPIPSGSLVLTPMQTSLIPAERRGIFVAAIDERRAVQASNAAEAFAKAGRCVYFHNSLALDLAAPLLTRAQNPAPLWAKSDQFGNDPRLAFFTFSNAPDHCRTPFSTG